MNNVYGPRELYTIRGDMCYDNKMMMNAVISERTPPPPPPPQSAVALNITELGKNRTQEESAQHLQHQPQEQHKKKSSLLRLRSRLRCTTLLDVIIFIIFCAIMVLIELGLIPHKRVGFICKDPKYSYPFYGETITATTLIVVSIFGSLILIIFIELLREKSYKRVCPGTVWYYFKEGFIGFVLMILLTQIIKVLVGEPRPHFFDTCQPDANQYCQPGTFIIDYNCTNKALSHYLLEDVERSFPSGHTSGSMFIALYCAVAGPGGRLLVTRKPEYLGQVLASLAVSLGTLTAGLGKGYSSPAIASLQQRDADAFPVTGQQASWLASLSILGALFGAPLGGAAVRWGRRRTLILASLPLSFCWILIVFAVSVEIMCLAAFLSGFLIAIVQLSAQVYVSEIAAPAVRGGLSGLLKITTHTGVLLAYAAGAFLDWRQLAAVISLAPAAMCLAMWKIPESPGFLVLRGRDAEAEEALRWLRGDHADLRLELAILQTHVLNRTVSSNPRLLLRTLRTPALIACGLMFFQRFSGANAFYFYVVSVFKETFGGTNPHSAAVAVAVVQLLSSLLSGLLVDSIGRLPLLVASSVLMSLALASFGSFAYYEDASHKSIPNLDWIPLLCVLIFTVAFSLGISPISWLLVTELFSLEHRGLGTAFATAFSYLCSFIGVKTFIDFKELLGLHGAFWLYAAISVCGLCFVVCCVPETKGRDLTEIDTVR